MASLKICIFFLLFTFGVLSAASTKRKPLSTYFQLCSRADQRKLNECVKNTITGARSKLAKGIPALRITPLKPMNIPRLHLEEGSGNFKLSTTFNNFVMHGTDTFIINNSSFVLNKDDFIISIHMVLPSVNITSDYVIDGRILVIPIQGSGSCEMKFTDVALNGFSYGRYVTRDGEKYLSIDRMESDIKFNGKAWMWFQNLFNGDERLGNVTNNFLNTESKEASKAFKHLPEGAFAEVVKEQVKNIFDVYPLSELFLDN